MQELGRQKILAKQGFFCKRYCKSNDKIILFADRVMIFSEYRDSVKEIATCLSAYQPLIKVMQFVGHGAGGNSSGSATSGQGGPDESVGAGQEKGHKRGKRGLTQKDQIAVVKKFREGGYNTLVSTCVGEEGLDIGEVRK